MKKKLTSFPTCALKEDNFGLMDLNDAVRLMKNASIDVVYVRVSELPRWGEARVLG